MENKQDGGAEWRPGRFMLEMRSGRALLGAISYGFTNYALLKKALVWLVFWFTISSL